MIYEITKVILCEISTMNVERDLICIGLLLLGVPFYELVQYHEYCVVELVGYMYTIQ